MGMEDVILLGGLAAIILFGYYIMAKLDRLFDKVWQENGAPARMASLNVATSCFDAIPAVSDILREINDLEPNVHCRLSVGLEWEVLQSFARGEADVAIISAESDVDRESPVHWNCVTIHPLSLSQEHATVEVRAVARSPQHQRVLWKNSDNQSLVQSFLHHLWGQRQ